MYYSEGLLLVLATQMDDYTLHNLDEVLYKFGEQSANFGNRFPRFVNFVVV